MATAMPASARPWNESHSCGHVLVLVEVAPVILDKLKAYGWMAAAITAGVLLGVQTLRLHTSQLDAATTRTAHADTLRTIADLTAKAERAVRAEETQRAQALEKIANDTQKQIDAARADAATAARAADSLRGQLARYVAAARAASPGASLATPSPATSDPLDLLAKLYSEADERAGQLAVYADAARIAGQACERAYDALTTP